MSSSPRRGLRIVSTTCEEVEDPEKAIHEEIEYREKVEQDVYYGWDEQKNEFIRDTEYQMARQETKPTCHRCGYEWDTITNFMEYASKIEEWGPKR